MREKISPNFYREEFECKCECGFDTVDVILLQVLEDIRGYFGEPLSINSACRCDSHNESVGGSKTSQHLLGKAADITMKNVTPLRLSQYIDAKYPETLGLGVYDSFVHVDSRIRKARWDKTS